MIDPALPEDLRFSRAGRHFIVLIEGADSVTIVREHTQIRFAREDFLHSRSDLPGKLAALVDLETRCGH